MKRIVLGIAAAVALVAAGQAHAETFKAALDSCDSRLTAVMSAQLETADPELLFCVGIKVEFRDRDETAAFKWYDRSANAGYIPAQYVVGLAYRDGIGVKADETVALVWLLKAADQGLADAQNDYAFEYFYGKHGIPEDATKAVPWLRKAAEQGYAHSQTLLAEAYYFGKGIAQDYSQAFEWYSKAAAQKHPYAMFALGQMYMTGRGIEKDMAKAIDLLTQSAEAGIVDAQLQLAYIYKESAVPDPVSALSWFDIYVDSTGENEPEAMKAMKKNMSTEDVAKARGRALAFRLQYLGGR